MNWLRVLLGVLVLWSSTAWGATLTWQANSEPDLAGYRVYQCSLLPCTQSSGNASLLVTLGTGTSFNIGTPAVTQYYFITAYDFANNESVASNLAGIIPAGSPPPPPPPVEPVGLTVVGDPATGPWGATLTWQANSEPDLAGYRIYQCSLLPCTQSSGNASLLITLRTTGTSFNIGTPTVTQYYFITAYNLAFQQSGDSNLAGIIPAGPPPPPPPPVGTVSLKVVGNPATVPWGVEGFTSDPRDVMASIALDGVGHHIEHYVPYGFPNDNGTTATTALFGTGSHTVEFVFYLEGTTTEIGRASVTVREGSQ